jgi:hypothetical protein
VVLLEPIGTVGNGVIWLSIGGVIFIVLMLVPSGQVILETMERYIVLRE